MDEGRLEARICLHEGYEPRPYKDTKGFWTVGYGHKIHDTPTNGIGQLAQAGTTLGDLMETLTDRDLHLAWLQIDIKNATAIARSWMGNAWYSLDPIRQEVVVELCFWMGNRARTFEKFKSAMLAGDWVKAGVELLDSKAGREFPKRMAKLAELIAIGRPI